MSDVPKIPTAAQIALRRKDQELLQHAQDGVPMAEIARIMGFPSAKAAQNAVARALDRVDKRLIGSIGALRAREFMRMERYTEILEESEAGPADPKVAAELRLQSAERRRMYAVDLQREEQVPEVQVNVLFETPSRRGETYDGEEVPTPALEPGTTEEP